MIRRLLAGIVVPAVFMLISSRVYGQNAMLDSIVRKIGYYGNKNSVPMMFVHLDKTVYVNGEDMWFTAYLLKCKAADVFKHQVLSAAIIKTDEHKIMLADKFVMDSRLGFGNIAIPDSIPPGNYSFVAYTNYMVNGHPDVFFVQPFTLKSASQAAFHAEVRIDSANKDEQAIHVFIKADANGTPVSSAYVSYNLGSTRAAGINGKVKTDNTGRCEIAIPRQQVTPGQQTLTVQIKHSKDTKVLHLFLPAALKQNNIKFYPEGGRLIVNVPCRVGWETKNAGGSPIKLKAVVYANNKAIDTITTNRYGLGVFYLNPAVNTVYKIKTPDNQFHNLPAADPAGIALRMPDALVNDTLKLVLGGANYGKVHLLVHNYNMVYFTVTTNMLPQGRNVRIDLSQIPRGLHTITVLDSLYRPCAERLFFAHYNQKPQVVISADKHEAGTRQKMNISLRLNGKDNLPADGLVSVACAQDDRYELRNANNIENYNYLWHIIDDLPLKDSLLATTTKNREFMNELLMIRGWSRYTWPELMKSTPADTVKKYDSLLYKMAITRYGKPLKKPVNLVMMKDSLLAMAASDEKGHVQIANTDMLLKPARKVGFIVNGKSADYSLELTDPYIATNQKIADTLQPPLYADAPLEQDTRNLELKGMEHATHLREVKIVADKNFYAGKGKSGANPCGDYVCRYHILNCPNHINDPENTQPVDGERYYVANHGMEVYGGCSIPDHTMVMAKGIYQAKEFYGADYSEINPTEPDYLSTLLWKHAVRISAGEEAKLSFYTSDITGKYRIVVQGITNDDVVYAEQTFTVKKQVP